MVRAIPPHSKEPVLNGNEFSLPWSRFFDNLRQRIGGAKSYTLGGKLTQNTTAVGNVGSGEDNLITYTLDDNTLSVDGDYITITAFGTTGANNNNKTIKLYLGSTVLFSTGAVASNNKDWEIKSTIIRTGSATQKCTTSYNGDIILVTETANYLSATEDLTTQLTIKCTGEGSSNNDVTQEGLVVNIYPVR